MLLAKAWCSSRWLERACGRTGRTHAFVSQQSQRGDKPQHVSLCTLDGVRRKRAQCATQAEQSVNVQVLDGRQQWTRRACCMSISCQFPHSAWGCWLCPLVLGHARQTIECPAASTRAAVDVPCQQTVHRALCQTAGPQDRRVADLVGHHSAAPLQHRASGAWHVRRMA